MSRGIGEFEPIQDQIPEWAALAVGLLTQLGDPWFVILLVVSLYWFRPTQQENAIVVAGLVIAGLGLTMGLKELFELPRPDQPLVQPEVLPFFVRPLYELTAISGGYGFPSGHAVLTTITYFGLAAVLSIGTRRWRYLAAGSVVTLVCLTRVALGVHYLVDVVVGVALGGLLLYGTRRIFAPEFPERGTVALGAGVAFALFTVITSNANRESVLLLGTALGAFGGWQIIAVARDLVETERPSTAVLSVVSRGLLIIAAFLPLLVALESFQVVSVETAGGAVGFVVAGLVILPVARHSERLRRLSSAVGSLFG